MTERDQEAALVKVLRTHSWKLYKAAGPTMVGNLKKGLRFKN